MRRAKALIAARVERMVETRDGEDKAMFFILNECPEEGEVGAILRSMSSRSAHQIRDKVLGRNVSKHPKAK